MKLTHLAFVLACLAASACGSILDFDVDQDVPEQNIEGSPLPGPLAQLFPIPIQIDLQSKIKAQETGPIDSVTLRSMHLDITATREPSGDSDDWSFVDQINLYVESTRDGSTLERVRVGTITAPGAVRTMVVTPDDVNLLPYINEGCQLTAEAVGDAPPDDLSFAGKATFHVVPL